MLTITSYARAMVSPFASACVRIPRWVLFAVSALAVGAIPMAAVLGDNSAAPFRIAESGQRYDTLQEAIDVIGEGSGTIEIAAGSYAQCGYQKKGRIDYVARIPGSVTFDGVPCANKAALVLRGEGATVSGLTFANIRVRDKNGAGIRLENGTLEVTRSWFRDSEQGILTVSGKDSSLSVDRSTFTRLGTCEGGGGCAHSIYVGDYGSLSVTRSRFEEGRGGHYLKSRAARNVIEDNSFDDSRGKGTNYLIDLPNGGAGAIRGNWFAQGKDKENRSTLIAVGAEDAKYSADGLVIEDNDARHVPGSVFTSAFVRDWTGDTLEIGRNTLGANLVPLEQR